MSDKSYEGNFLIGDSVELINSTPEEAHLFFEGRSKVGTLKKNGNNSYVAYLSDGRIAIGSFYTNFFMNWFDRVIHNGFK